MKKLLTAAGAVATLAIALPAAAQTWDRGGDRGGRGGFDDSRRIERVLERGVRDGSLSDYDYRTLSRDLVNVRRLERQFFADGRITDREAQELDRRYAALDFRIAREMNGGRNDRRYGGYDNRDGRYGDRFDNRYDDRYGFRR